MGMMNASLIPVTSFEPRIIVHLDDIFENELKPNKPIKSIKIARFSKFFVGVKDSDVIEETIEKALEMYFEQLRELSNNEEYEDEYDEYDDEDGLEQRVAESDKLNSHKIELSVYDAANRLPLEQRQAFINSVEQGFMNYKCR